MMRKFALPILVGAMALSAAEVEISGSLTVEGGSQLDQAWKAHNMANQDLDLTIGAKFDEKTAVELYLTNTSTVKDSAGNRVVSVVCSVEPERTAFIDDAESRWGQVNFDGIQFQWEFNRMATLLLGDMTWSGGSMNYYGYQWAQEYGSIMRETVVRGLGIKLGEEGEAYVGAPDANDNALWAFAAYRVLLTDKSDEKWSVRPMMDFIIRNGGRNRGFTLGTETEYMKSLQNLEYGFHGAYGALPFHGKMTHTFLAEPSMSYKKFNLGGTFYTSILAKKDSAVSSQTDIPEQMFASVEPSFTVLPKLALGVGGEWHNPSLEVKDDHNFAVVPAVYLYPSDQMSITVWSKYQWLINAGDLFSFGAVAQVEF